jgi:hypothetical protein
LLFHWKFYWKNKWSSSFQQINFLINNRLELIFKHLIKLNLYNFFFNFLCGFGWNNEEEKLNWRSKKRWGIFHKFFLLIFHSFLLSKEIFDTKTTMKINGRPHQVKREKEKKIQFFKSLWNLSALFIKSFLITNSYFFLWWSLSGIN